MGGAGAKLCEKAKKKAKKKAFILSIYTTDTPRHMLICITMRVWFRGLTEELLVWLAVEKDRKISAKNAPHIVSVQLTLRKRRSFPPAARNPNRQRAGPLVQMTLSVRIWRFKEGKKNSSCCIAALINTNLR